MIRSSTFPCGARLVGDRMSGVRSCALGIWVETGSRDEKPGEFGVTHFIEHMLFKGTTKYDALQLADALNRLGGAVNASTSHETLCLNAQCVDVKAPRMLELMLEMLHDSTFPDQEIERERNVILEECKMYEDSPDDLVFDLYYKALWPQSPLGRSILGNPHSIEKFSSATIHRYLGREFDPSKVLIVLAGGFDRAACRRVAARFYGSARKGRSRSRRRAPTIKTTGRRKIVERDSEQVHFCFGTNGPPRGSKDRYAFGLLNMILGGGSSSRLFREVREKRGLAYSIQSFAQPFQGAGSFGVAGATSPETLGDVLALCVAEIERICNVRIGSDELELAREQINDALLLSVESTSARMMRLAESFSNYGEAIPYQETLKRVNAVTPAEMKRAARKYLLGKPLAGAFIGPHGLESKLLPRRIR